MIEKENLFYFSEEYLRQIKNVSKETKKRVVIGFNENQFGQAVVTTGVAVEYNHDKVSYVKKKTLPYERHILNEQQKLNRRR